MQAFVVVFYLACNLLIVFPFVNASLIFCYLFFQWRLNISILDSRIPLYRSTLTLCHPDLDDPAKFILGPDYINDGFGVRDSLGHGTHVAGIASEEINNSTGIAGVAGGCKIMVIQVFGSTGSGTWAAFKNGVIYAVDHGVKIINYSGGGTG